jgi:hypothetical protein
VGNRIIPGVTGSTRPARAAWPVLVAVNALLAVGAAVVLVPWLVVLKAVLAELGLGSVDPTLVDDGLSIWVLVAVAGTALYAVVAASVNLLVVRRARLRGQPWPLVTVLVTVAVAVPLSVFLTPSLW